MHDAYRSVALDAEDTARISGVLFGTIIRVLQRHLEEIGPDLSGEAKGVARDLSSALADSYNTLIRQALADLPDDATGEDVQRAVQPIRYAFHRNIRSGAVRRAMEWAEKRAKRETALVIAFDLDNCALQWQKQLVPVANALDAAGCPIGVITGNRAKDGDGNLIARQVWDDSGYPEPAFWEIHEEASNQHIAEFKAEMCRKHRVALLIDDFKQGSLAETFRQLSDKNHLGLQLLLPPGTKPQRVGSTKAFSEQITRTNQKFAVPSDLLPSVSAAIAMLAAPDPFDPEFRGQEIVSVYFDTETELLLEAKKAARNYLTLRLRHYLATDSHFLEAKTAGGKFRVQLTTGDAAHFLAGHDVAERAGLLLPPELAAKLLALAQGEALRPVVSVMYRRYARESGGRRLTLDTGLHTGTGKTYPTAVLELKFEDEPVDYPELDALELPPLDLSKFVWAMTPPRGST